jgi:ecdysteroid kinase
MLTPRASPAGTSVKTGTPQIASKARALKRVGQVLSTRAAERLKRDRPLAGGEVPRALEDITPEWLTAVLCASAPGAWVTAVRATGRSAGTTTRQALEVSYNDAAAATGLPTRLFVKCTATAAQRLMLGLGGMIGGEPGFYDRVRPFLEVEAPVGYFAALDRRSWRSVVVLEDVVATRGASFWQPSTAIDRKQIERLLSNMAAWHGTLWGDERLDRWSWLKTPAAQMRVIDSLIGMANRMPTGLERAGAAIAPAVRERQHDLRDAMRRSMQLASEGTYTYLHGDLHIANTYLTAEGKMGVADWQVGLKGSWAFDCAYMLATALEIEDRRAWEAELLDFYLEQLAAAGGGLIRWTDGWLAYRQSTFYPCFAWLYTIGRARFQPRFQPDEVSRTMIRRISAAIHDLDSFGAVGL